MIPLLLLVVYVNAGYGLIMPMTKPDGSLDVSSLLSHISLLEQTIESKASSSEVTTEISNLKTQLNTALTDLKTAQLELRTTQTKLDATQKEVNELKQVRGDLKETQLKVAVLESKLESVTSQCSCNMTTATIPQSSADISSLTADVSTLKTEVFHLQSQRNSTQQEGSISSGGVTFTRWGRTSCPNDTKIVYKGYTGGSQYMHHASSATIICLPEHPVFPPNASSSGGEYSYIYGTEYEMPGRTNPLHSVHNEDMPCVVCDSDSKRSAIMVPATNQCYPGWHLEYSGSLMGPDSGYESAEYICLDNDPEAIPGGQENKDGQVLYIVKSVCGSLPCPPYGNNLNLQCAVCTK